MSDSLYNFAQELKVAIVKEADGKDGSLDAIKNKEDLESAAHVMLAPGSGKGKALFNAINSYRTRIVSMVNNADEKGDNRKQPLYHCTKECPLFG